MKVKVAIRRAGSINKLALLYGVSRQVVQGWKRNGFPQARLDELRTLRPEWFADPKADVTAEREAA